MNTRDIENLKNELDQLSQTEQTRYEQHIQLVQGLLESATGRSGDSQKIVDLFNEWSGGEKLVSKSADVWKTPTWFMASLLFFSLAALLLSAILAVRIFAETSSGGDVYTASVSPTPPIVEPLTPTSLPSDSEAMPALSPSDLDDMSTPSPSETGPVPDLTPSVAVAVPTLTVSGLVLHRTADQLIIRFEANLNSLTIMDAKNTLHKIVEDFNLPETQTLDVGQHCFVYHVEGTEVVPNEICPSPNFIKETSRELIFWYDQEGFTLMTLLNNQSFIGICASNKAECPFDAP